jgi:two-component system, cell cycle sensor histidine kinase and response regulator CckA
LKKHQPEASEGRSNSKSRSGRKSNAHREQAEKLLSEKKTAMPRRDAQQVTHEEIGLEVQNEELRRAQDTIIALQQRYADLYDFAPVGYFMFDGRELITEVNLTGASLLGVERDQLKGEPFSLSVAAESRDAFHRHHRDVSQTGTPDTCELQLTRKDGTAFYASLQSVPVRDAKGNLTGVRSAISDITEQKRIEDELRQARKMEAIGNLAGGIAHDFNNILADIIGFTELAIDNAPEGSLIERNMNRVLKAGSRGRDLVRQILTFNYKNDLKREPLHLTPVVIETVKLLKTSLPDNVTMVLHTPVTSDEVLAESAEIRQLLMNLGTNAAKAMREHGGHLEIALKDIEFYPDSHPPHPDLAPRPYVEISVKDTGCGMDAATRNGIFEPFFTTKERGQGTGLGLALVRGIAERLRGAVTVSSEVGQGTLFTTFLPKVSRGQKAQPEMAGEVPGGKERILVVDDEESFVEIAAEMLGRLGYEVVTTTESGEALRIFSEQPERFHLVITDQMMPDMTGRQLARKLIALRPDIPIILATGFSYAVDASAAQTAGIRAFVMKPLTKEELARTVRKVLDDTQAR